MKKTLLLSAASLLLASSLSAQSRQWEVETLWGYVQKDMICTPVPGLDGGWSGLGNADAKREATCSRFAVGLNGKIITTDHKTDALIAIDAEGVTTFKSLAGQTTLGSKWNGTAVSTDDAGNVIFNYNFTNVPGSIQEWGVITNDVITNVTLSTPVTDLGKFGRVDCLGHVTGDVTSAEGGIGYVTSQNSGTIIMLHFTGDGSKVTKLTATPSTYNIEPLQLLGAESQLQYAVAKYPTVKEILADGHPENCFYAPYGRRPWNSPAGALSVAEGPLANFTGTEFTPIMGIGNRMVGSVATIFINGKTYVVRNYLSPAFQEEYPEWSVGHGVMNYGIFDLHGRCVASWMGSEFGNGFGMSSINAEKIDDYHYNIYTIYSTSTDDSETSTMAGFYCAMTRVTIPEPALKGAGTEADPYIVATADDLANAWTMIEPQTVNYFKQTADIDMAEVTDYHAINGFNGDYSAAVVYDGQNHIIYNFAPESKAAGQEADNNYYCNSVFGVLAGKVSNLGIVDAKAINTDGQGAAILGVYGGHGAAPKDFQSATIDNVFVTGKAESETYVGGMIGTTGNAVNISNSYAVIDIKGGVETAGLVSRATQPVTLENVYVAGTVSGGAFVVKERSGDNYAGKTKVTVTNVVAIDPNIDVLTNATDENLSGVIVPGSLDNLKGDIQGWTAFNEKKTLNGYPTLNWLSDKQLAGIGNVIADLDNENAPVEYFNLQGIRVENPSSGLYIKRQGKTVTKVIIR